METGGVPWDRVIDGLGDVRKGVDATNSSIQSMETAIIAKLDMMSKFGNSGQAAAANAQLPGGGSATAGQTQMPVGHIPGSGAQQPAGGTPPGTPAGGGAGGGGGNPLSPPVNPPGPPAGGTSSTGGGLGGLRSRIGSNIQANGGGALGAVGAGLGGMSSLLRSPAGGILYGALSEGYKLFKSESENAARYQGMEGPSLSRHGGAFGQAGFFGEVLNERKYAAEAVLNQFGHPGGFSGDEAAQAFVDVTSAGYNSVANQTYQPNRRQVLDFMDNNKRNLGMDEHESASFMKELQRNPTVALSDLSDALTKVSDAAGKAGVNAMEARANFLTMFHGLTDLGAGRGAAALAGNQATALAHLGRGFQDINTATQFDEGMQYRVAAASGLTPGAYQNIMRTDPNRAQGLVDKLSGQAVENMIGGAEIAWIKTTADKKYGGRPAMLKDPSLIDQLANDWSSHFQGDMITLRKAIQSTTNVAISDEQVPVWVIRYVMKITASQTTEQSTGKGGAVVTKDGKSTYAVGGGPVTGADAAALAPTGSGNTGQEATRKGGGALDKAQQAYYDVLHRKGVQPGRHEPGIEKLLNMKDHANMVVLVHAKGGDMRKMKLDEAIKYYPDEIASGRFSFLSGNDEKGKSLMGQSFSSVTGLQGDSRDISGEENKTPPKVGSTFDEKDKDYAAYKKAADAASKKDAGAADGNTTLIDLAPGAKWLLKLVKSGDAVGDAAKGLIPNPDKGILGDIRMGIKDITGYTPW